MKVQKNYLYLFLLILLSSCAYDDDGEMADSSEASFSRDFAGSSGGSGSGNGGQAGLITAGEWNDLDNWSFWQNLTDKQDSLEITDVWQINPSKRISIAIANGDKAVCNATVELKLGNDLIWKTKSDNFGKAELWIGLFGNDSGNDLDSYKLFVNGNEIQSDLKLFQDGVNEIQMASSGANQNRMELSFVVDATGSMSDELEFLKDDLNDVIQNVKSENSNLEIFTSSVFYRDEGDDYVVRQSDFTSSTNTTINFIKAQQAGGGGDFPEAVHTALKTADENLQWSENASTKIIFLLLDAPPHSEQNVVSDLQKSVESLASKGVKIIPIVASGIGKQTEFLMRRMAMTTNGTYVFITNDSGIGNEHIEATVGDYEVEYLNNLMVRLINKYAETD